MSLKLSETPKQDFIEYNDPLKRLSLIVSTIIIAITLLIIAMNILILNKPPFFEGLWFLSHMSWKAVGGNRLRINTKLFLRRMDRGSFTEKE